jgi:hypothetical protein
MRCLDRGNETYAIEQQFVPPSRNFIMLCSCAAYHAALLKKKKKPIKKATKAGKEGVTRKKKEINLIGPPQRHDLYFNRASSDSSFSIT